MTNRIRHFRKLRGLKLRELADRIGTTPQSVSRLETGHMTLSLDWLNRIADALEVHPTDLIDSPAVRGSATPLLGHVGATGLVEDGPLGDIEIAFPVARPVAVRLLHAIGGYRAGEVLVADRRDDPDVGRVAGRDALVELGDGSCQLVRVVPRSEPRGGHVLVSLDLSRVLEADKVRWVAPVVMSVRYF
ncbi:MAG: helix-turn-helix domain-containing protein [Alphaproteobacteria bacterium]|nr:helix-turn-helix domain-containing protein [Alphaproteobacteria bacterium]MDX5369172.1 helix-turn-helix domain-containing protein [Alphaproteobacteria bacterium]MDX5463868.1 helix-turn-helix domain-containing protein [Alphaproteobacteria bacterium]